MTPGLALLALAAIVLLINLAAFWFVVAMGYRRAWRQACVERGQHERLWHEAENELERQERRRQGTQPELRVLGSHK